MWTDYINTTVIFQSTHPVRGATIAPVIRPIKLFVFQSTHPVRGATFGLNRFMAQIMISIHAPREGCDGRIGLGHPDQIFQSTHPVRGATIRRRTPRHRRRISIHAPREGCDCT